MALTIRNLTGALAVGVAVAFNAFKRKFVELETTFPHFDITSTPSGSESAPDSDPLQVTLSSTADLAAVIAMAEEERDVWLAHMRDEHAHTEADDTNIATLVAIATATDQTTVNTLLNAIKAVQLAHLADTTLHAGGREDETNVITAADASNLGTSQTLVADAKAQINAHITFGWASPSINIVAA